VEPELLVLDEPFVSLDEATAAQLRALIGEVLAERRATAVLVTHALEDAAALADRVAMLSPRPARLLRLVEVPRGDVLALRAALATAPP
jgi:NitT/TauT family transport system ATP-binding protein